MSSLVCGDGCMGNDRVQFRTTVSGREQDGWRMLIRVSFILMTGSSAAFTSRQQIYRQQKEFWTTYQHETRGNIKYYTLGDSCSGIREKDAKLNLMWWYKYSQANVKAAEGFVASDHARMLDCSFTLIPTCRCAAHSYFPCLSSCLWLSYRCNNVVSHQSFYCSKCSW